MSTPNGAIRRAPTALMLKESPFFFFNDTATTEIYTLSLHDALPISRDPGARFRADGTDVQRTLRHDDAQRAGHQCRQQDRKSTRLNSSHLVISYAVFCLKKKKTNSDLKTNDR